MDLIAQHGDGSFRDSISLLDQLAGQGSKITADTVRASLGIPSDDAISGLLTQLSTAAGAATIVQALAELYEQGFQPAAIAKSLARELRSQLVRSVSPLEPAKALDLLAKLLDVPASHDPERYLEVVLLSLATVRHEQAPRPAQVAESVPVALEPISEKPAPVATKAATPKKPAAEPVKEPANIIKQPTTPTSTGTAVLDEAIWNQVLGSLKKQYNTLYGIIRMAQPDFSEQGRLVLTFAFAFHQKRMNEAKNQQIISQAIATITGGTVEIECRHDPDLKLAKQHSAPAVATGQPDVAAAEAVPLATISNIFGGGELIQS